MAPPRPCCAIRTISVGAVLLSLSSCGWTRPPDPPGTLRAEASFRQDGAHFMQGALLGDSWAVGLSMLGLATFTSADFQPRNFPDAACARLLAGDGIFYCTHHRAELQLLSWSAADHHVTAKRVVAAPPGASLEGMALWNGKLVVAARRAGLLVTGPGGEAGRTVPLPRSIEAWDLAPLDDHRLVVAAGATGLAVLDLADPAAPALVSMLALPGVAVSLHLQSGRAYVASLSGGAHVVDLADPAHPALLGSLQGGGLAYEALPVGDQVIVSTGYHQITAALHGGRLLPSGLRASDSWALAASDDGSGGVYTAEFSVAGRYRLVAADPGGPFLRIPMNAAASTTAAVSLTLPFENVGDAPLTVEALRLSPRTPGRSSVDLPGFTLAPGERRPVSLALDPLGYLLEVNAPGNRGSQSSVEIHATDGPVEGQPLPGPLVYRELGGTEHDVGAAFAGRVGFLLVGAASCPVAFYALHAARRDLAPYLGDGRVAAFSLDPWDNSDKGDLVGLDEGFPHLLSPLTTSDSHDQSWVLDHLGRNGFTGAPMPIVYVVGRGGTVRYARWGYEPAEVAAALDEALAAP